MNRLADLHLFYDGPIPRASRDAAIAADIREAEAERQRRESLSLADYFDAMAGDERDEATSYWQMAKRNLANSRWYLGRWEEFRERARKCLAARQQHLIAARTWEAAADMARRKAA